MKYNKCVFHSKFGIEKSFSPDLERKDIVYKYVSFQLKISILNKCTELIVEFNKFYAS